MKRALVIGGTGPTGPHVLQGLLDRGYDTCIFHRGTHEPPGLPEVEHIHGDPHFEETIAESLYGRQFDLVVAMYGRIRFIADYFAKRCERFLAVGGIPVYRGLLSPEDNHPFGLKVPTAETAPLMSEPSQSKAAGFGHLIYHTERHVLDHGESGAFNSSYFRYPAIYGPRQPNPMDWSVIKRVIDGRTHMILPEGGLMMTTRCAARNAAHYLLLAIDKPDASKNQVYNCVDEDQYTLRQWMELISTFAGRKLDMFSVPKEVGAPARMLTRMMDVRNHCFLDGAKAREQLGYRDQITAADALKENVEWYMANPVTAEEYPNYPDPFNYEGEDRLMTAYTEALVRLRNEVPFEEPRYYHSYAHPRKPGQGPDHRGR